jgi:hypothetical protein
MSDRQIRDLESAFRDHGIWAAPHMNQGSIVVRLESNDADKLLAALAKPTPSFPAP